MMVMDSPNDDKESSVKGPNDLSIKDLTDIFHIVCHAKIHSYQPDASLFHPTNLDLEEFLGNIFSYACPIDKVADIDACFSWKEDAKWIVTLRLGSCKIHDYLFMESDANLLET